MNFGKLCYVAICEAVTLPAGDFKKNTISGCQLHVFIRDQPWVSKYINACLNGGPISPRAHRLHNGFSVADQYSSSQMSGFFCQGGNQIRMNMGKLHTRYEFCGAVTVDVFCHLDQTGNYEIKVGRVDMICNGYGFITHDFHTCY